MAHTYIFATVLLSIYTQLVLKWQLGKMPSLPASLSGKLIYLLTLISEPWILSTLVATFIGGVSWMAALSKFPVSYAFPFVSLAFVGVLVFDNILFNESITVVKVLGMSLIVSGLVISSSQLK